MNELARSVGLSHPKLNQGFREIYGVTVFDYLRQKRLENARSYIQEGRMNITEAAYATGFSSSSHFSRAFLKYFGIQPSLYLNEISKKAKG